MYADLEEARARRARHASRSPELEIEKRRAVRHGSDAYDSKERELRNRVIASRRANGDEPRGRRPSIGSSDTRRSVSRSRSRSRDSVRSRRSHHSRRSSQRVEHDGDDRRKRRHDPEEDRRREEEADEQARERQRRRNERYGSHDREHAPGGSSVSSHRSTSGRYNSLHDDRSRDRYDRSDRRRGPSQYDDRRDVRRRSPYDRPPAPARARRSPTPEADDYEERSVFCTQLSVRLGQRDLGEFFEEHLGEGAVKDVRIVMDRITRRSKGVGYVEFAAKELVPKAIALTGQNIFGVPIVVQITDAARNRVAQNGADPSRPNMSAHPALGGSPIDPTLLANIPLPMQQHIAAPLNSNTMNRVGSATINTDARLYVGSLHFSLTDDNIKSVFESFGEIDYVDLHREPETGKSKGFCFIQFKHPDSARRALEQMNGFELAGRTIRVGNVNAKGGTGPMGGPSSFSGDGGYSSGHLPQLTSSFDDGGGAGLNPERRAALMEKLARNEPKNAPLAEQARPASIPQSVSTSLLLTNMFDPKEETEPDWHKDLADDVREECQSKYGPVTQIHIEKDSAGEIYITFADNESSSKALQGLNGRFFGGKPISAQYIPDAFVKAKLG